MCVPSRLSFLSGKIPPSRGTTRTSGHGRAGVRWLPRHISFRGQLRGAQGELQGNDEHKTEGKQDHIPLMQKKCNATFLSNRLTLSKTGPFCCGNPHRVTRPLSVLGNCTRTGLSWTVASNRPGSRPAKPFRRSPELGKARCRRHL